MNDYYSRRFMIAVSTYLGLTLIVFGLAHISQAPALKALSWHLLFPSLGMVANDHPLSHQLIMMSFGISAVMMGFVFWVASGIWLGLAFAWGTVLAISMGMSSSAHDMAHMSALGASAILFGPMQKRKNRVSRTSYSRFQPLRPREATDEQLQFLSNRAMQDLNAFEGFTRIDQFQTAALRYQINFMGIALALNARHDNSQFANEQRKLVQKQFQPETWRYWKFENRWGNFDRDPNPLLRENIMYSGFLALQIEAYHRSTSRSDFDEDGAISLRDGDFEYATSQGELIDTLAGQYQRSKAGFLCCEPGWIYALCNLMTACAIKGFDARNGTTHWARLEASFFQTLDESFTTRSGKFRTARSRALGLAIPNVSGLANEALCCLFLNTLDPRRASEHWNQMREVVLKRPMALNFAPIDLGNYRLSYACALSACATAAAEMNDREVYEFLLASIDQRYPLTSNVGQAGRKNLSIMTHDFELMARGNQGEALRRLLMGGA